MSVMSLSQQQKIQNEKIEFKRSGFHAPKGFFLTDKSYASVFLSSVQSL